MKKRLSKEEKQAKLNDKLNQVNMVWDKYADKDGKKKEKSSTPRGYAMRKVGFVLVWSVIVSVGFYSAYNGNHDTSAKEVKVPVVKVKEDNPATSQAAVQFAKDFVSTYFTWNTGDEAKKSRQEQMIKYLADGLDEDAGLNMDQIKTVSVFKDSKIKSVESVGQNKAKIVLSATYEITPVPEPQTQQEGAPVAPSPPPKPIEATKTIVVPVQFDGNSFGVYELPTFTTVPEKTTLIAAEQNKMTKATDTLAVQNITNFLNTFFESYAQDGKDKLSYILEDSKYQNGLQKTMNFVKVEESTVYEGKSKNQYVVVCIVQFADPVSESQFLTNYHLTVEQRGDQYVVTKIN